MFTMKIIGFYFKKKKTNAKENTQKETENARKFFTFSRIRILFTVGKILVLRCTFPDVLFFSSSSSSFLC